MKLAEVEWKVPLFKTYSDKSDLLAIEKIITRGTYWADGPEIKEFENRISEYVGKKYALAFNSGTSALLTLLLSHNIKDKEVIIPSFTFIATANAVMLAGGKPVFADIEPETFALNPKDVETKINKNTVAIMPIHYGGFPGKYTTQLKELAENKGILFLEDAAQSLGAEINTKKVGSFGDSIFSFCQNKLISTGEGGMMLTDSRTIYEKAKLLRSHGRVELQKDYFYNIKDNDYIEAGYNFRMPTVIAALGLSQLNKIDKLISRRRYLAKKYNLGLSSVKGLRLPVEIEKHRSVYQMYSVLLDNMDVRDKLQEHLSEKGIMSKVYFNPIHLKTLYIGKNGYSEGSLPKTEEIANRILNIPLYPSIKDSEITYLLDSIKEFLVKA